MSKIRIKNSKKEDVLIIDLETARILTSPDIDMHAAARTFFDCLETALQVGKKYGTGVYREMILNSAPDSLAGGDYIFNPGNTPEDSIEITPEDMPWRKEDEDR